MNNKTIIEFGFGIIWRIMDISEGVIRLGHTLRDLHNSSDDTQPHWIQHLFQFLTIILILYFCCKVEHTSRQLASNLYDVAREAYFARHEITDDSEVDVIPRYMNGDVTPLQEQRPNDDDSDDFPSPRFRRSSSIEKERLLFESTV